MRFKLCIFIFFLFIFNSINAQDSTLIKQKIIYVEALGNGDVYSLNAEYLFKKQQSIRLGLSWLPGTWQLSGENDRSFIYIPAEYNYLFGKRNHKLDLSCGLQTLWTIYNDFPNTLRFTPQVGAGYRYQRIKGGIFFRTGMVLNIPIYLSVDRQETFFYTANHWLLWPAISTGWSF